MAATQNINAEKIQGNLSILGITGTSISATTISGGTFYGNGANLVGIPSQSATITGGTYSNGTTTFTNSTGGTFNVTGYYTGTTDVYVTGGTYSSGNATFTNNTGGTFTVTGFSVGGGGTFTGGTVTGETFFTSGVTITGNTTIIDSTGNATAIDTSTRELVDSGSIVSINWDQRLLYDGSGINATIDYGSTLLYDTTSTPSVEWGGRQTYDEIGVTAIDWTSGRRILYDDSSLGSLDWKNRNLIKGDGTVILDWQSGVLSGMSTISATTISGGTLYGDGSNLTGIGGGSFTGGTVTGPTNFTNGLSANTISATTYQNLTSGDLASVQAIRTTSYTLQLIPALITFNTTTLENQPSVIEHDNTNTERIYVYETGLYSIHYHCDVAQGTTVNDFEFAITKNTLTILSGGTITGKNSSTDKMTVGVTTQVILNTNDYVSLAARYVASSGGIVNNATLSVTKMEGVVGPAGISGATGPQGPAGTGLFTGGTITSPTNFTGGLSANTFSATTISGGTLYGDGSNLTGLGGGTPGGTNGEVQFNNGGSFSGAPNVEISNGNLQLVSTNDPSAPSAGNLIVYTKDIAGRQIPKWIGPSGVDTPFQPNIMFNNVSVIGPGGGTTVGVLGCTVTSVGTISNPNIASTNLKTQTRRIVNTSAAGAGSLASTRVSSLECWRGNAAGLGGFFVVARFGQTTLQTGMRMFVGLTDTATTAPTNIDPTTSTTPGKIGMAINASTGNWNLVHNITGTAPTVIALGGSYPVDTTSLYEMVLFAKPNDTVITYRITNLSTTAQTSGTLSTNLPATTTPLGRTCWATNNATAAAVVWDLSRFSLESDY